MIFYSRVNGKWKNICSKNEDDRLVTITKFEVLSVDFFRIMERYFWYFRRKFKKINNSLKVEIVIGSSVVYIMFNPLSSSLEVYISKLKSIFFLLQEIL